MTLMTLFTAPKPFTNPHIATIQRNAIRSWTALPDVEVVLMGEEEGLAESAAELGVRHIAQVRRNTSGTPLVSSMFELARQLNDSPLLACVNADILLLPDFVDAARHALARTERFLVVGQRWDLDVTEGMDFSSGWADHLLTDLNVRGKLHARTGSDYFIYPRDCFIKIPDFAIGRAGWDNWMIYEARQRGWKVMDATESVQIVHQNHDYSHFADGKPHYRQPETFENIRLAGGKRMIFHLMDSDSRLVDGKLLPARPGWIKFWREVEIFPLVKLHSYPLAQVTYAIFHPSRAYRDLRAYLHRKSGEPG